ncbi:MAG: transposase [Acidimicrobiia bacterium]|nr:transposase [Acidimicrobiia bacterium]
MLAKIAREGARKMLATALENEMAAYIASAAEARSEDGRRLVVKNGHAEAREVQTGFGAVPVRAPRLRDGRKDDAGEPVRF